MVPLAIAFLVTALLYASVGFGGGSTYTALLALAEVDYRVLPLLSLACNLVVVAGSTVRFARARVTPWGRAMLLTAIAAPAAFLGGLTPIAEQGFVALLGTSLLFTALTMMLPVAKRPEGEGEGERGRVARYAPLAALPLGYISGLVGIGGGIFLAPLLHLVRWDSARAIAATASLFILVNSLFGLAGQVLKGGEGRFAAAVDLGLPLLVAVAIGGQIGSLLALRYLPQRWIRWGTGALTAFVGGRLLLNL
ncbi:sulfite exporter TauE/SafE family protein [Qipengyuania flava]|uniref:sulfite exporter TauE/SafE family protein n=1 Tax=Qipengyuania flava TaxID=192812 RepID=UPI000ECE661A|nr:sulfite exporter TauE/SafE family protein [Qipengyuania flava]MCA0890153.1 sulfite exporter TauE/SafE family protein [Qipengyuania flava]HCS18035.1 sulfoacetate transporter [Erythrobacter sp.]